MSFPATRLSLVARTKSADPEARRLAFASLIEAYWKPVYKYLRLNASLASELGLTAATVTNHLATMRRELRRHGAGSAARAHDHR